MENLGTQSRGDYLAVIRGMDRQSYHVKNPIGAQIREPGTKTQPGVELAT